MAISEPPSEITCPPELRSIHIRIAEYEREIRRHHRDFERWEQMAAHGAAVVAERNLYRRALEEMCEQPWDGVECRRIAKRAIEKTAEVLG